MLSFSKLVVMLKTKFSLATAFPWLLMSFLIFCCSKFDEIEIKCFFLDYVSVMLWITANPSFVCVHMKVNQQQKIDTRKERIAFCKGDSFTSSTLVLKCLN